MIVAKQDRSPLIGENAHVIRLAIAQALAGANSVVTYASGSIVGHMFAPNPALDTLPITIFVIGMAVCTLPAGTIAQKYGRKTSFLLGTLAGILAGLVATVAVLWASFWLYCLATFFAGAYAAVVLSFRFAAADCVPPEKRANALSLVMAGGVFAGVIGPQLVTHTMDLWPSYLFAATYIAQALVAALSTLILLGVRIPKLSAEEIAGGRSIGTIARQPQFIIAVLCGLVSYLLMNFLMTAAPLAMKLCGLSQADANTGLQWHVIAMYAPSFFTGKLITRFGASRIVFLGLLIIGLSAGIGLLGIEVSHFWGTLILLGIGWNFGFVGASALVLDCHRPEEKARVQSLNDFIIFGTMAIGSFLSGGLLAAFGWKTVLWLSWIPLIAAMAAVVSTIYVKKDKEIKIGV